MKSLLKFALAVSLTVTAASASMSGDGGDRGGNGIAGALRSFLAANISAYQMPVVMCNDQIEIYEFSEYRRQGGAPLWQTNESTAQVFARVIDRVRAQVREPRLVEAIQFAAENARFLQSLNGVTMEQLADGVSCTSAQILTSMDIFSREAYLTFTSPYMNHINGLNRAGLAVSAIINIIAADTVDAASIDKVRLNRAIAQLFTDGPVDDAILRSLVLAVEF